MRAELPVEALSDADLASLLRNVDSGHDGLCQCGRPGCADVAAYRAFFAELAEVLRSEVARRRVESARYADPIGHEWFGRLSE